VILLNPGVVQIPGKIVGQVEDRLWGRRRVEDRREMGR